MTAESQGKDADDYYQILGIDRTATDEEIDEAYRKLALRLHPDKNPDPNATAQFQKIEKAHRILKNSQLRSIYDVLGEQATDFMDQYGGIAGTSSEVSGCKRCLYSLLCSLTGCGFCCGCFCVCCGCCCCCNFCCNRCCGKCKKKSATVSTSGGPSQTPVQRQPAGTPKDSTKY